MQVLGVPTSIFIWWSKRVKSPTRKIKGGAGALVLKGDKYLQGAYEPQ